MKKLPIGRQSIEYILNNNYLYVDKTEHIYNLLTTGGGVYFLSRPRRFGKSLLISTLDQIFQGNKELFKEQWIYSSDYDWKKYPVIKLSMGNVETGKGEKEFVRDLNISLDEIAEHYNITLTHEGIKSRLIQLIKKLSKEVVILIDEYDKPILDNIDNVTTAERYRDILRSFYSSLKDMDDYIRFIFITGVSKFSKTSIFSGLNNLDDITMDSDYASLLGITQDELESNFKEYIEILINESKRSKKDIKDWYNGYRFTSKKLQVYNPFSTLQLFKKREFGNFWIDTATPTFLIKLLRDKNYNLHSVVEKRRRNSIFSSYELDKLKPHLLLLQTGYLTIKNYDEKNRFYYLDFPNNEVQETFNEVILDSYTGVEEASGFLYDMKNALYSNDLDSFFRTMRIFFSGNDNTIMIDNEKYYQSIFYSILRLLGVYIDVENNTNIGRIDAVIHLDHRVYVMEFKLNGAKEGLKQIKDNKYYEKYMDKEVYLVGVEFKDRNIGEYIVERV